MKLLRISGAGTFIMALALLNIASGQLIYWQKYIETIAQRLVADIEKEQITGTGMPMETFENLINRTQYGLLVEGTVKFHSGFIGRINSANLKPITYRSSVGELQSFITTQLAINGMEIVYDIDYDLVGYKETGTFLLYIPETLFDLYVTKDHQSQVVSGSISYITTGNQNAMVVNFHPNNGYTQLVAREVKQNLVFRANMTNSFSVWNAKWQTALQTAIDDTEFPDICYYCP